MKNMRTYLFFLLSISLIACKEELEVDIPASESIVVVEAQVTNEVDSSYVKLTKTVSYYSTQQYPAITDAVVTVNNVTFNHVANGVYKPASPYRGYADSIYLLNINHNGKTYTSLSKLDPMYRVDTTFQTFRQAEGFLEEGYAISYVGFDERPLTKYTYFRFGLYSNVINADSLFDPKILFNNSQTPIGIPYPFELPFVRYKKGDIALMEFRSVSKEMTDFIEAYNNQTSGAPGPFQVPPANLPTNIRGGAIGYFATYDVVRKRHLVN